MNGQTSIELIVERLLQTLEQEAEHLAKVTDYLAELSRLIMRRDEKGLQDLLDRTREETLTQNSADMERKGLVVTIAGLIGCAPASVTLSMLEETVPSYASVLKEKRLRLRRLVEDLRRQHYSTTMLLGEMIRINRSLLAVITGNKGGVTYGRGGQAKWAGAENILNLKY